MQKKILTFILRFGVSGILLAFLFSQQTIELSGIVRIARKANPGFLSAGLVILLCANIACLFRWQMLLKGAGILLPLKRVFTSYSGGLFFNLFMPSTIGGDLMRTMDLAAHTKKPQEVVATVVLDRLSGYVGLVIIAVVSMAFGWSLVREPAVAGPLVFIFGILLVILLALFNSAVYRWINRICKSDPAHPNVGDRIKDTIKKLHHEMYIFRNKKLVIARNILISIFVQATAPFMMYCIARAIGVQVPFIAFFIYIPIISAITLLPISIGGLGLRDATMVYFFSKVGMSKEAAFTMSLCNFVFIVLIALCGGLWYVFTVRYRRVQST